MTGCKPHGFAVRLARNSRQQGECVFFTGELTNKGYGRLNLGVQDRKKYGVRSMLTHRASWLVNRGEIPEGMNVLHTCDNRPCFRIEHLYLGTIQDNSDDMVERGRHFSVTQPELVKRGSEHGMSELTEPDVLAMREEYARTGTPMRVFAERFGVSVKAVLQALQGLTWAHVGGPRIAKPPPGTRGRGRTKITPLLAEIIRVNYEAGTMQKDLARWFGVTKTTICSAIARA